MEHINWNLLPAEELDKKVDEILAGNDDITDEMAQQILLRHAELVKRGTISPSEGYLARKKAAQRVMVPNTNFLKQVLKQTIGVSASEGRSERRKRARSPSASEDEQRAHKRRRTRGDSEGEERSGTEELSGSEEQRMGPQPARVMRGRGSSGATVLDAVFEREDKTRRDKKKHDKKEKKKHKKDKKKHKRDKKHY